jgi:hypothetical protein
MSLLPTATFVNPNITFYGNGGGGGGIDWSLYPAIATLNLSGESMINGNALEVSTINTSTINAVTFVATNMEVSTINTSTINVATIDLDGQLLTANASDLLLNGVPVATISQLSNVADWSIYPAILAGVDMANLPISNASTIELNSRTVTTGLGNTILINGTDPVASWANYMAISSFSMNNYDIVNISSVNTGTLMLMSTGGTATGNLTTNSNGSVIYFNNAPIYGAEQWSLFPSLSSIDMRTYNIDNVGSLTCAGGTNYAIFGAVGQPMEAVTAEAEVIKLTTTNLTAPMELHSGADLIIDAVGVITVDTPQNIAITSGNNLDLEGDDLNLTQTSLTSVLNISAVGAIAMASGVGIAITAGTTIQILCPGNVSIGSGNVAGADTEIEKVGFLDNQIYPAGGALFDLQISGVQILENLGNSMRVQAESAISDNIGLKLITLDRTSGNPCCKISLADDNRVILGDDAFTALTTTLEFDVTGPFVGKMEFNGTQFSLDTQLNMSAKNVLGVASLTATNIVDSTASTGTANQVLSAGVAGATLAWVTAPNSGFTPFTSLTATAGSVNIPLSYADSITYYLQDGTNPTVTVLIVSDAVGFIDLPPGSSFTLAINPNTPTPTTVTVSVTTLAFPAVFNNLFTIVYPDTNNRYTAMKTAYGGDATSWVYMKTT